MVLIFSSVAMPVGAVIPAAFPDDPHTSDTIRIGLLIPDSVHSRAERPVRLAMEEAGGNSGFPGTKLQLVVRSTEGPWGAGSKESVSLVYDDRVSAILGALDGRNGHLAEQVAAKSHLTYLETVATESTLSQAFVPYFMRCIPNDDQQARAILNKIDQLGKGDLAILSIDQYDIQSAARSFQRIASSENRNPPWILSIPPAGFTRDQLLDQLRERNVKNLVLPFRSGFTEGLPAFFRQNAPGINLYATLAFIADLSADEATWNELEGMFVFSTGLHHTPEGKEFQKRFKARFGQLPTTSCAYTYDGAIILIEAIRKAGSDREAIRDTLCSMMESQGVSGSISFDEMGNRKGPFELVRVTGGIPVAASE